MIYKLLRTNSAWHIREMFIVITNDLSKESSYTCFVQPNQKFPLCTLSKFSFDVSSPKTKTMLLNFFPLTQGLRITAFTFQTMLLRIALQTDGSSLQPQQWSILTVYLHMCMFMTCTAVTSLTPSEYSVSDSGDDHQHRHHHFISNFLPFSISLSSS